ncbi:hypothetical protein [Phenylobacterium sp. SCN 70-31]|uniref:hypothetical protein n=1 Tax=Phenylobacterium sp. SCN 70-31 TaxID=1660129 RepID=UPI00086CCB7D|nr:hypothetical protein [Phenylobacterium sp. SCN 70-31]ODT86696.1 MAG: hypothetical protein ABS78_15550 [Phenylobacterium sp. SCN 70-31]
MTANLPADPYARWAMDDLMAVWDLAHRDGGAVDPALARRVAGLCAESDALLDRAEGEKA